MKIDIFRDLMRLVERNRDGSHATQAARRAVLAQAAKDLKRMGFRTLPATGLKPKHVTALLAHWHANNLSTGTIKNRMSHVRWWAEKIGKQNVVPRTNAELGIDRRTYVTNISKALRPEPVQLDRITDERLRCSIELQRVFGLRREECLKFQPRFALAGRSPHEAMHIHLKASWCKGGRERFVPVTNDAQRAVLARASELAGTGSMIPPELRYVDQLRRYEWTVEKAGLSKLHGLRHEYAQQRYRELTGWPAPAAGGAASGSLSAHQRRLDHAARLTVSAELGHGRESITSAYLGR